MSHQTPLITVIIPVFNTERYLARCLNSVINQSQKNIEIIIVNDLSTDNSEKIIQQYKNEYPIIKYYKMRSKGLQGGARNLALKKASGKYIGFVDSDDWIDSNMYEKMVNTLESKNAEIAIGGVMKEYNHPSEATFRYKYDHKNIIDGKFALELLSKHLNQDISISSIVCNKLYKFSYIKQHHLSFIRNSHNDDDVFNYIAFLNAKKIAIIPDIFYHYYQRQDSLTHSFSKKHIDDLLYAFGVIKKYLEQRGIFDIYKDNYFSFFEKCLSFVLNILITTEQNRSRQIDYINHLFIKGKGVVSMSNYLNYVGAHRLRDFLNP